MNSNRLFLISTNYLRNSLKGFSTCIFLFITFLFFGCSGSGQNSNIGKSDTVVQPNKTKINYELNIRPQNEVWYKTIGEIPVPEGFSRLKVDTNSFGQYLRNIELKTENNIVHYFDGNAKSDQHIHFAIIKMDAGNRDLQQCADAVMRLRAEYLWNQKRYKEIHFNFLSDGKPRYYTEYVKNDFSYQKFRKYMDYIFAYANTSSLKDEMKTELLDSIRPGDVFIQKGSPYGHAVIVVDVAVNKENGKRIFMIAQSFMPAQEIHILVNQKNYSLSPWYESEFETSLITPQWMFYKTDLMRFK